MDRNTAKSRIDELRKEIDYHRTGQTILNEFRAGLMDRITLESPQEQNKKTDSEE